MKVTMADLSKMGLKQNPDGSFSKGKTEEVKKTKVGRPSLNEAPIEYHQYEDKCHFILHESVKGLNGSKGLIRMHWTEAKQLKSKYVMLFLSVSPRKWQGKVKISFIRHSVQLMDSSDNLASTGKHLWDALVTLGVIEKDSPDILTVYPGQAKSGKKDQRFEFIIEQA
jgi:hypothetical protein